MSDVVIVESDLRTVALRANGNGFILTEVSAGTGDQLGTSWIYLSGDQANRLAAAISEHVGPPRRAWDQPTVAVHPNLTN